MTTSQHRDYIRHPTSIPLEVQSQVTPEQMSLQLNNVSVGGLAFTSPMEFHPGALIKLKIRAVKPVFKVHGIVQWCRRLGDMFELGVQFLDQDDAFRVRMVEQVCHIEEYRKYVQTKQGRRLSKNQASLEWIQLHGKGFPGSNSKN
ncbi:MAG: PilZ domain-containing protein [Oleiphilaceae bacterium]|nr:PilZ domain-containing protein [Oleiphilaceae bacterium]